MFLEVFDINGRRVAVLFAGRASAGNHRFTRDASNLAVVFTWCGQLREILPNP
jgi:hypothetical protein